MHATSIPLDRIVVKEGFNPRTSMEEKELKELTDSIAERGLLQPIRVHETGDGMYELVAGERRFQAVTRLKHTEVDAIVVVDQEDSERLVDAIVENVQREDLNAIQEAMAYDRLVKEGLTVKGAAQKVGVTQKRVTERLELLKLPAEVAELVEQGKVGMGPIKALVRIADKSPAIAGACAKS